MKSKRKLKGMTLMEVVISIGVYAITALLLTEIMTLVNATIRATNQLNRRLAYESKFADNLLVSDNGTREWDNSGVQVSINVEQHAGSTDPLLQDPSGYTVRDSADALPSGTIYKVDTQNYTRKNGSGEGDVIIQDTNYRFMIFTKTPGTFADQPDSFRITLNLARDDAYKTVAIPTVVSKLIVRGRAYQIGSDSGTVYTEQTITQRDPNSQDLNPFKDAALEAKNKDGMELIEINIPEKKDTGESYEAQGSIEVLIFTKVRDINGKDYWWYDSDSRTALCDEFAALAEDDPNPNIANMAKSLDNGKFPATQKIKLDYNMFDLNPNTGNNAYFSGVTYTWNYDTGKVTCAEVS